MHHGATHFVGQNIEPLDVTQLACHGPGAPKVGRHVRATGSHDAERRSRIGPQHVRSTAVASTPYVQFGDYVPVTRDAAARDAAQSFVEGDVDGVEETGDIGNVLLGRSLVIRRGLPEPGPVEVHRRAALAGPLYLTDEFVPRWQVSADVALRKLQQKRGDWLFNLLESVEIDGSVGRKTCPDEHFIQVVYPGECIFLMGAQVR